MLVKLQGYILKYNVNWPQLSKKFSQQIIDQRAFQAVLKEINPLITSHESAVLFEHFDPHRKGAISWGTVEKYLVQVDYRASEDVASRKIDDIVAILKAQKADPIKVFDNIDLNHSGSLDFS